MSEYTATIAWARGEDPFLAQRYTRAHRWLFDGGTEVAASASPEVVHAPWSDPAAVDPEEAFVAALASCHMLFFLALASKAGFVIDRYEDRASGLLAKNAAGKEAMVSVTLRPSVAWGGAKRPSEEDVAKLHHDAHERCYIANSVTTEIHVEPR
jgi:organic hydroperoxide reductase OsmC/OhrA